MPMDFSRAQFELNAGKAGESQGFVLRAGAPEQALVRVTLPEPRDVAFYVGLSAPTADARLDWRVYLGAAPGCSPSDEPIAEGSTYLEAGEARRGALFTIRGAVATAFVLSVQNAGAVGVDGIVSFVARNASSDSGIEAGPVIG